MSSIMHCHKVRRVKIEDMDNEIIQGEFGYLYNNGAS